MIDFNTLTEESLIGLAQNSKDDDVANEAMKCLRKRFDVTYFWCPECDYAVTKKSQCCLTKSKL